MVSRCFKDYDQCQWNMKKKLGKNKRWTEATSSYSFASTNDVISIKIFKQLLSVRVPRQVCIYTTYTTKDSTIKCNRLVITWGFICPCVSSMSAQQEQIFQVSNLFSSNKHAHQFELWLLRAKLTRAIISCEVHRDLSSTKKNKLPQCWAQPALLSQSRHSPSVCPCQRLKNIYIFGSDRNRYLCHGVLWSPNIESGFFESIFLKAI